MAQTKNVTLANLFPHAPLTSAELLALVRGGKIDAVRKYLDAAVYGRDVIRPEWEHLRAAAEANDVPMAKLMHTWGATATAQDLKMLVDERGEKAARDLLCLRMAGLSMHDAPAIAATVVTTTAEPAKISEPVPAPQIIIDKIPQEWKSVLTALQAAGAKEAMIAGGALRDLDNDRVVKDVDIFLADGWMNKRLIKKAFADAGLTIHDQMESTGYGQVARKMTRGTKDAFNAVSKKMVRDSYGHIYESQKVKEGAEAWTVIAGPNRTEYNIVFIKGEFGKLLKTEMTRAMLLVTHFDIGICQIAYDGRGVHMAAAYNTDVREKKLTLTRPNHSSKAHLQRVHTKYADFALCPEADKLLHPEKFKEQPKATPKQSSVKKQSSSYITGFSGYHASPRPTRHRGFSGY